MEDEVEDLDAFHYKEFYGELSLDCKILFVDFEGRAGLFKVMIVDGKSIKNILSQVAPRKLVSFRLMCLDSSGIECC